MKVFLSWAGDDSRYIAETLKTWLPQVLQALDPWMSTHIEKGDAWDGAIAEGLSDSPVGILCLTKDSINSNYLHYEAGAIANVHNSQVCTFLYGLKNADVKQPLGRFQHTRFEKEEVLKLLKTINSKLSEVKERSISDQQLEKALDVNWPELEDKLNKTPKSKNSIVERPDRELLEEILERVRFNSSTLDAAPIMTEVSYENFLRKNRIENIFNNDNDRLKENYLNLINEYRMSNDIPLDELEKFSNDIKTTLEIKTGLRFSQPAILRYIKALKT